MDLLNAIKTGIAAAAIAAAVAVPSGRSIELAIKEHANANPSIAASNKFVVVTWSATAGGGAADVYAAVSRDAGLTFTSPVRVNDVAGDARVGGEQPPRVTLIPRSRADPSIVIVWTTKASAGTRLLAARSNDGGRSFGRAAPLPGSDAPGNRGWESIATDREGRMVAIWLDHRDLAESGATGTAVHHDGQSHTGHAASGDGVARAQLSKLYFARADQPGSARALTGGVCYCCKTTLAIGPDGFVYAAWRHVFPGNVRDIAFSLSRDGGRTFSTPARVSEDRWVLDGCPENGPAMAVDAQNRVHLVWPTLVNAPKAGGEPTLELFYAASPDGRQFSPRLRIPTEGTPRHPQIAVAPNGSLAVAWDERANGIGRIVLARSASSGQTLRSFKRGPVSDDREAVYPAIVAIPDGIVMAWTSGTASSSRIRVERLSY
jgi:hypothetical protein